MQDNLARPLLKRDGPTREEIEIIGIEFTIDTPNGENVELAMFSTSIIIPRTFRYGGYNPRITFHTSIGDLTLDTRNIPACYW